MTHVDLRTLRLAPGDHRRLEVPVTISPFTAGAQEYRAEPSEVQAQLGLTRLAGGLLFDLAFDVGIVGPCQRCLQDARELVEVRAREYQADIPEVDDEETTPYLEGERLDVDRWATDGSILALPIVIRCRDDCAGLCPQCGADRNLVACACEPPKDERWERLRELL
ncbi:MAG: hypothetical protein QOD65_1006 [Gaiellales bacterium]|nr:hypothetical protein [Gaiellales bacterium]